MFSTRFNDVPSLATVHRVTYSDRWFVPNIAVSVQQSLYIHNEGSVFT